MLGFTYEEISGKFDIYLTGTTVLRLGFSKRDNPRGKQIHKDKFANIYHQSRLIDGTAMPLEKISALLGMSRQSPKRWRCNVERCPYIC